MNFLSLVTIAEALCDPGPEAKPNNAWPCRDLDGTPIRWTLSYTRETLCLLST